MDYWTHITKLTSTPIYEASSASGESQNSGAGEPPWAQRVAGTSPNSHSQSMALPGLQPPYLGTFLLQSPGSTGLVLRRDWLSRVLSNSTTCRVGGGGEQGNELRVLCEGQRQVASDRHL